MKRIIIIITFLTFLFLSMFCFTEDTVELLTMEYPPYSSIKGSALGSDLINAAFAREGVTVTWSIYPQDREKILVASGMNVAFASSTLVIGQDEKTYFVFNDEPYLYLSVVAFYKKAKYPGGLGIKSAADLKDKTVGVVRGTGSVVVLEKAGANLDIANDTNLLMKKLVGDRHDIAVVTDLTGFYALRELVPDKLDDYAIEQVYSSPLDLIFSSRHSDSAEMRKKFNSGLAKIKADGTYLKILAKYYPNGKINKDTLPKDMR